MNRFFAITVLSTAISLSGYAQAEKDQNHKRDDNRPEMPMQQMSGRDSLQGRPDMRGEGAPQRMGDENRPEMSMQQMSGRDSLQGRPDMRGDGAPQRKASDKGSQGNDTHAKGMPDNRMGSPEMRNVRILTMKINKNDSIGEQLKRRQAEQSERYSDDAKKGLASYLLSGYASAGTNLLSSFADNLVNAGLNALIKVFKGHHEDWNKMNQRENTRKDSIAMTSQVNDFYSKCSFNGALDPDGLQFDGITLEKQENDRTIFKLVTHLDNSEEGLDKILGHSKFSLVLDTLYLDVRNCGLPNRDAENGGGFMDGPSFSFKDRKAVSEQINLTITSSYISPSVEVFHDVKLGSFNINLREVEAKDTLGGCIYEYHRSTSSAIDNKPIITGESFIVPRSYNGIRDPKTNEFKDFYGFGEYKVSATLITSCQNTPEFEEDWKDDWKSYQKRQKEQQKALKNGKGHGNGGGSKNWFVQYFSQNYKSWITTAITTPVSATKNYVTRLIQEKTGVNNGMGGQMGGQPGEGMGNMQGGMNANGLQDGGIQGQSGSPSEMGGGMPQEGQAQAMPQEGGNPPVM